MIKIKQLGGKWGGTGRDNIIPGEGAYPPEWVD